MKAKHYFLTSLEEIKKVSNRLLEIIPDGKIKVTFSDAGSKSSKQRGLDWMWTEDICKAWIGTGSGNFDTKEDTHLYCKWHYAIPIFQRDDADFSDLFDLFKSRYGGDPDKMRFFVKEHVSTEKFNVSQMAEYLTEKQNHFTREGVMLREPEFRGLLDK